MPAGGLFIHPGAHAPGKYIVCPAPWSIRSMPGANQMSPVSRDPAAWVAPAETVRLAADGTRVQQGQRQNHFETTS